MRYRFALVLAAVMLAACAHDDARRHAAGLARSGGLAREDVRTRDFLLATWSRFEDPDRPVQVYIEGDGLAWRSRNRLSDDPTPQRAIGLALAAADRSPNVVYLARPCQYIDLRANPCDSAWWSGKRFAGEVVRGENEALDALVRKAPGQAIHLVGYSGGAAIAVMIAAHRHDVASLRTVAGNLDSEAVNRFHGVSPMPDSLNPVDYAAAVAHVPQIHFTGIDDEVVPPAVASNFAAVAGTTNCIAVEAVPGAGHESGWVERWPSLFRQVPRCRP
ncbi:MAG TPA: alpha/beta hydrolase [Burkholderiales bacterium]|nr:alpha/beta hydrolase [Burkholderiales bacterium]